MTHAIHKSSKLKPIKTKEKQKKRKETYLKKKNTISNESFLSSPKFILDF